MTITVDKDTNPEDFICQHCSEPRCSACGHAKSQHAGGLGMCSSYQHGIFCRCARFSKDKKPRAYTIPKKSREERLDDAWDDLGNTLADGV